MATKPCIVCGMLFNAMGNAKACAAHRDDYRQQQGRAWRAANKGHITAYKRAYRESNKEREAAAHRAWREANREHLTASKRAWREANEEALAERMRVWRAANKDRVSTAERVWREENRAEKRALIARRRAARLVRTPAWADHAAIKALYAEALRLTRETGIEHQVDHVIPLQGRFVSGLHVETNLQILTATANHEKFNRFKP